MSFIDLTTTAPIFARTSGVSRELGASSTSFWCRRWMEHSRSPRWMTFPNRSARNWNSIWRPPSMNFSTKTVPFPNAFSATERAEARLSSTSAAAATFCIPFPPPPADALMRIGHPTRSPNLTTFSGSSTSSRAGVTGTPEAESALRAAILSPRIRMTRAERPDEDQPLPLHRLREVGVLREEPVPREDRVAAGVLRRAQDGVDVEVAHRGGGRRQAHRLVGEFHVQGQGVAVGVPHHHGDPQLPRRPDGPAGDLPPVRDEDFPEDAHAPGSTRCPCR